MASKTHEQLLDEVNNLNREELQEGTPAYRLSNLLGELAKRFPNACNLLSSAPPEIAYLQAIDNFILKFGPKNYLEYFL